MELRPMEKMIAIFRHNIVGVLISISREMPSFVLSLKNFSSINIILPVSSLHQLDNQNGERK